MTSRSGSCAPERDARGSGLEDSAGGGAAVRGASARRSLPQWESHQARQLRLMRPHGRVDVLVELRFPEGILSSWAIHSSHAKFMLSSRPPRHRRDACSMAWRCPHAAPASSNDSHRAMSISTGRYRRRPHPALMRPSMLSSPSCVPGSSPRIFIRRRRRSILPLLSASICSNTLIEAQEPSSSPAASRRRCACSRAFRFLRPFYFHSSPKSGRRPPVFERLPEISKWQLAGRRIQVRLDGGLQTR